MSCEIIIMVMPSAFSCCIVRYISAVEAASSPAAGSSKSRILPAAHSALAKSTLCCWPPERRL